MPQRFPHMPHTVPARLCPGSFCSALGWQEARPDCGAAKHHLVPYPSHASSHCRGDWDCSAHLLALSAWPIPSQSLPFLVFFQSFVSCITPTLPHIWPCRRYPLSCLTSQCASGQHPWLGVTIGSTASWLLLTLVLMPGSNLDLCVQSPWEKVELREWQELCLDVFPPVQGISARGNKAFDRGSIISHCNLCALVSHLCLISHNLVCKQDLSFSMP